MHKVRTERSRLRRQRRRRQVTAQVVDDVGCVDGFAAAAFSADHDGLRQLAHVGGGGG